jgi:hypothetical protein
MTVLKAQLAQMEHKELQVLMEHKALQVLMAHKA